MLALTLLKVKARVVFALKTKALMGHERGVDSLKHYKMPLGQEESIQSNLPLPQLEKQGGVTRGHCKILFFLAPSEENRILVIGCLVSQVT